MKIAVISTTVFRLGATGLGGYGGLEQIAWLCARGLATKGHDVSLFAPDESECPGVTIVGIGPERRLNEQQAYSRYWQLLPQFDVVIGLGIWSKLLQ